jgi:hypothetical protein
MLAFLRRGEVAKRKRLTAKQQLELWEKYDGKCWRPHCRLPLDKHKRGAWHWGHIVAHSCGGTDEPENMAPECRHCNEKDNRENATPMAAENKRIAIKHIGAKPQSDWSKRHERIKEHYVYDWKRKSFVPKEST